MNVNLFDMTELGKALVRDGFVFLPNVLTSSVVSEMRLLIRREIAGAVDIWNSPLETVVPNIVERGNIFRRVATNGNILGVLFNAMGQDIHLVMSHGHFKRSNSKSHTAPHSDIGHLRGVDHDTSLLMVKCMIALSDISENGGGLEIFPRNLSSNGDSYPQKCSGISTYFSMRPGDAIIFNAGMMHSATNNGSSENRLTVWLAYAHTWMKQLPSFETSTLFLKEIELSGSQVERQIFGLNEPYCAGAAVALPDVPLRTKISLPKLG